MALISHGMQYEIQSDQELSVNITWKAVWNSYIVLISNDVKFNQTHEIYSDCSNMALILLEL